MNLEAASLRWYRNLLLASLGFLLIVLAAFLAWRKPGELTGPAAELKQMLLVEHEVLAVYDQAKTDFSDGKIDAQTFVGVIKSKVLAPWREAQSRFRKIDPDKLSEKGKRRFESLVKSMKLREQAWGLVADSIRDGSQEGMANAAEKAAEADRIEDEILAEVEGDQQGTAADRAPEEGEASADGVDSTD